MTKKLFAISTLLLVLVIGAIFVYNFVFKKPSAPSSASPTAQKATSDEGKVAAQSSATTAGTSQTAASAEVASQQANANPFTAISDEPVFGAVLSPDGSSIYYFSGANGQLNQIDLSGKLTKVLSTEQFVNIKKIIWNKPEDKAIIKTEPAPGSAKFLLFDIAAKKVTALKDNIDSISWSDQGDKIIYKYYDPKTKKRTISISDPDGSNWHDLADFNYQDVSIAPVPDSSQIAFWPTANAFTPTSLNTISFSGGNKKELVKDRYGADFLWAPDGTKAIVSCSDQQGGHKVELFSMNGGGGQFQTLTLPTFASKCVWSHDSKNLYCAMAGNIPDSAILPNDWQAGKVSSSDTFWKIDTTSGKEDHLIDPQNIPGAFDAINLFLSGDEKTLFFTNKSDGKLYKIKF